MTPEGKELKAFKAFLKAAGLTSLRLAFMPGVETGWPDTVILLPGGLSLWIELKAPGKTPRPIQTAKLEILSDLGYIARFFDNAPDAIGFVVNCLEAVSANDNPHRAAQVSDLDAAALYGASRRVPVNSPRGRAAAKAGRA
jgi:hypothetical protein